MPEAGIVALQVEKLVAGGDGLAFLGGKAVFVPLALPGEKLLARLVSDKRDFARAEIVELLEPSPHRIEAPCPLYGKCGGCNLQHLAYPRQVEEKSLIVAEVFARTAKLEIGEVAAAPSMPFGYRNRMQLHFTRAGGLGLARRASAELVEVVACPIACASIGKWIEGKALSSRVREELLPYLGAEAERFIVFGSGEELWIEGRDELVQLEVGGRSIRFPLQGFFQSNLSLLGTFVAEATEGLSGDRAADLYSGVGLFGSFLARNFISVVCVEENAEALAMAKVNLPGSGHEFHALSVEAWCRSESAAVGFDLVLVDPPRTGLAPALRSWLGASKPPAIVYLSCDPVTLARDARELLGSGYELAAIKLFDFYPQTSHMECYARFELR
jgi:23S rRNA (uracil1939-C5)-methyltransferase